jgi:ankyrin repeat protein
MEACANCDREMVTLLLRWNADVSLSPEAYPGTAISAAVAAVPRSKISDHKLLDEQREVIRVLLEAGAPVNLPLDRLQNPLAIAIHTWNLHVARQLLEAGANPNLLIDRINTLPPENAYLEMARGNLPMFALLREYGARP